MARPMTHKWGPKVHPMLNSALMTEKSLSKVLTPLHISVELLPLGLFSKDHAEAVLKVVNLVSADSASKGNGMWQVADEAGMIILAMKRRVDEGKAWNCTVDERQRLIHSIVKMDRYMRTWTNKRFTVAAITIDRTNAEARSQGKVFMDRVELKD